MWKLWIFLLFVAALGTGNKQSCPWLPLNKGKKDDNLRTPQYLWYIRHMLRYAVHHSCSQHPTPMQHCEPLLPKHHTTTCKVNMADEQNSELVETKEPLEPLMTKYVSVCSFMEEIRKHPILYDKLHPDFKEKPLKDEHYKEIGSKFGISGHGAEGKYRSIRSSFGRYYKKRQSLIESGRTKMIKANTEFEKLDWLVPHIEHRHSMQLNVSKDSLTTAAGSNTRTCESETESDEFQRLNDMVYDSEERQSFENGDEKSEVKTIPTSSVNAVKSGNALKRSWSTASQAHEAEETNADSPLIKTLDNLTKAMLEPRQKTFLMEDEDILFAKSIIPQLKRLPMHIKAYAKLQIQQTLFQCEFSPQNIQQVFNNNSHNTHQEQEEE